MALFRRKWHFWRKTAHLGPECTSMEFIRKCRSERLLCQKIKLFLQKTPSAREGRDRRNFRRKCDFLPARLPKSSRFLDPDSGPVFRRSAQSPRMHNPPGDTRKSQITKCRKSAVFKADFRRQCLQPARGFFFFEFLDPDSGPIFDPFLHKCEKRRTQPRFPLGTQPNQVPRAWLS